MACTMIVQSAGDLSCGVVALAGIAAVMRDVTAQFEETRALRKEVAALREQAG